MSLGSGLSSAGSAPSSRPRLLFSSACRLLRCAYICSLTCSYSSSICWIRGLRQRGQSTFVWSHSQSFAGWHSGYHVSVESDPHWGPQLGCDHDGCSGTLFSSIHKAPPAVALHSWQEDAFTGPGHPFEDRRGLKAVGVLRGTRQDIRATQERRQNWSGIGASPECHDVTILELSLHERYHTGRSSRRDWGSHKKRASEAAEVTRLVLSLQT